MTVISVSDLSLSFGTNVLLENVSFSLNETYSFLEKLPYKAALTIDKFLDFSLKETT